MRSETVPLSTGGKVCALPAWRPRLGAARWLCTSLLCGALLFSGGLPAVAEDVAAMSVAVGGGAPDGKSEQVRWSRDGRFAAFRSFATNLVAGQSGNANGNVFWFDRYSGEVLLVSHHHLEPTRGAGFSRLPAISADGQTVVFRSAAADLVAGFVDANGGGEDLFHWRRGTGQVVLASHAHSAATTTGNLGVRDDYVPSANGRFVAFSSDATDLVNGTDGNGTTDIFLFDAEGGTRLVSREFGLGNATTAANDRSELPDLSDDGMHVSFVTRATNLRADVTDTNGAADVYVWNRLLHTRPSPSALVSRSAASPTTTTNGTSDRAAISRDGAFVAYLSSGTDSPGVTQDLNGGSDVFLFERATSTVTLISHQSAVPGSAANGAAEQLAVDARGEFVAFTSFATNLVAGQVDANGNLDLLLWSRATNSAELVNHQPGLLATTAAGAPPTSFFLAATGGDVVFATVDDVGVAGLADTNAVDDIFHWDRATSEVTLVSHLPGQPLHTDPGNGISPPVLSGIGDGGRVVGFATDFPLAAVTSPAFALALYHAPRDFLLLDGFESGTTSSWSSVRP